MKDRFSEAFGSVVRAADPRAPYRAIYAATVVAQRGDLRVDVQPDDKKLPPMANIPLRVGIVGARVRLRFRDDLGQALPKIRAIVSWEDGNPSKPYVALVSAGPESVEEIDLGGLVIKLGASAREALVLGTSYRSAEDMLVAQLTAAFTALQGAAVGPLSSFAPGCATALAALTAFQTAAAGAGGFLSTKSSTE